MRIAWQPDIAVSGCGVIALYNRDGVVVVHFSSNKESAVEAAIKLAPRQGQQ